MCMYIYTSTLIQKRAFFGDSMPEMSNGLRSCSQGFRISEQFQNCEAEASRGLASSWSVQAANEMFWQKSNDESESSVVFP